MWEAITKIWFLIAILPYIIFLEGNTKFGDFLKRRKIYSDWDVFHAYFAVLVALLIILWLKGYR